MYMKPVISFNEYRNISLRSSLYSIGSSNDIVSKNITLVLENLLKDYESSQLPTYGKGMSK